MSHFIQYDFLLQNKPARILYHEYAKDMPIIDYHCHLDPKEIAQDKRYKSITEIWLGGDHYKWRTMRTNGIDEEAITGKASDKEKFLKWAETMPYLIGNPLYHWTQLELKRYFDIDLLLGPDTAEEIWEHCNLRLSQPDFSARGIIKRSNVEVICTTDDPADTLEYHRQIRNDESFDCKVLPTFRPDRAVSIEKQGFRDYVELLSSVSGVTIGSFADYLDALESRIVWFHENQCRLSDHALEPPVFVPGTEKEAEIVFKKALDGHKLTDHEIALFKTRMMLFLGKQYARLGWVMQLHIGTQRDNNTRMLEKLGPNTGFDMMSDYSYSQPLARYMDGLDRNGVLPRTILYVINPRDNEMITTLAGCFQGDGIPGKIQFGSGWWFNDQKDGMIRQMTTLANMGLLSRFVGMLTDSRSFLSYTRHEYFRRILCNMLGTWVVNGEAPNDMTLLGKMAQDIAYYNAKRYFQF
ncbi:MAG: glucuronate isomerase [Clostridiaceae bacterium]|nr:glucuronate isomerase [Bacillota bacterium]NLI39107.1 glucuronate isomerase [Clostridiaceae bacterium]